MSRTEHATTPETPQEDARTRRPQSFRVGASDRTGRYADAVRVPAFTDQVMTSGTPCLTPTGAVPETFEAEARQAWLNVRKALLAAGACLSDLGIRVQVDVVAALSCGDT